MLTTEIRVKNC